LNKKDEISSNKTITKVLNLQTTCVFNNVCFKSNKEGWFYPLFTTRSEAIQEDIGRGGRGVYRVLTFYGNAGEFYIPDSYQNIAKVKDPIIYTLHTGDGAENPFKRIQNKLSILIENQFPGFVQNDYSMFITFIKA
jgi:hypothetical protein